jgi:hypothetical protein
MSATILTLISLIELAVVSGGLYWYLRRQPDRPSLWLAALRVGLGVGLLRVGLASGGWYFLDQGGLSPILAIALALTALPEVAVLGEVVAPVSAAHFVPRAAVLSAGTITFAGFLALVVEMGRRTARQAWSIE